LILIYLELPQEETQFAVKLNKTAEIESDIEYLKRLLWIYANNEKRYNMTAIEYKNQVEFSWPS
jgi:hypothetical protein